MVKVFISYNRAPSAMLANLIPCKLNRRGIKFFLDTVTFGVGPFPEQITKHIESCDVFVCLLAPPTLSSEYVFNEIRHAVAYKKMLIPVFQDGFDSSTVPPDAAIQHLLNHNGIHVRNDTVDYSLDRLGQFILQVNGEKPPVRPTKRMKIGPYQVAQIHPPVAIPPSGDGVQRGSVQIILDGNINSFDQQLFRGAVSGMLGIPPDTVAILRVQPGSIQVEVGLTWHAALQLYYSSRGQWPLLKPAVGMGRDRVCPTCRRVQWFLAGVLLAVLMALGIWQYDDGDSDRSNTVPDATTVMEASATNDATATRTPRPTSTTRPTRTPRGSSSSGQGVQITPTRTPSRTPTRTRTPTATFTASPSTTPTLPPIPSNFSASYSPTLLYDPTFQRYLVYSGTDVTFYATLYDNICGVIWRIERNKTLEVTSTYLTIPQFDFVHRFTGDGEFDIYYEAYTCDAGNPLYPDTGPFEFVGAPE